MQHPILILGSGIAGLSAALKLAPHTRVTLVTKASAIEGSTRYAQGGIASVWSKEDSFDNHIHDTLIAGDDLCNPEIVRICVTEGPQRVQELIDQGVLFTQKNKDFDLHKEGGHSHRRILHADDLTGLAIEQALLEQAQNHPNIQILENHVVVDLLTDEKIYRKKKKSYPYSPQEKHCIGAYVLDTEKNTIIGIPAHATILATGGAGKVYLYTSNPDTATGDGIAMAYRAGARIANLEFMQFHPTCLYHPQSRTFLISEALRGEGALLLNLAGERFMKNYDERLELAPRDIVARAIDFEMKKRGDKHVLLDCRGIGTDKLKKHFPHISENCKKMGIDIAQTPLPVVPAAHYTCGGVVADSNGATTLQNLYAVGEVASTGLHGANRLASNSLLEGIVFAHRAAEAIIKTLNTPDPIATTFPLEIPKWETGTAIPLEEQIDIAANWLEIRSLMWNYVGIVRSNRRLERAKRRLEMIKTEVNAHYWNYLLTKDLIELRNLLTVAELTVQCAMHRKESRGLHYTVDYPAHDDRYFKKDTIL